MSITTKPEKNISTAVQTQDVDNGAVFHVALTTDNVWGNTLRVTFTTPNTTTLAHMNVKASVYGTANFNIIEAYTSGCNGGSTLTPLNRYRDSTVTSTLTSTHGTPTAGIITQGASVGVEGTTLHAETLQAGASEALFEGKIVLKANTGYIIELLSVTASLPANLVLDWAEKTI